MIGRLVGFGIGYFGLLVFALLALTAEVGFRIGRARGRAAASLEKETAGVSTVTTAMLAFVAFTLALTTGIAESRFEARRLSTRDEANSIGTAGARTGLASTAGKPIAALIEEYARVRLAYVAAAGPDEAAPPLARTDVLQNAICQQALPVVAGMPRLWAPRSCPQSTTCSARASRNATRSRAGRQTRRCLGCSWERCSPPGPSATRWGSQPVGS